MGKCHHLHPFADCVLFLLADLLSTPARSTALVLILTETLRGRSRRTPAVLLEWVTVAVGILVISFVYRFTLSMVLIPLIRWG
jgi:hypothetical protein